MIKQWGAKSSKNFIGDILKVIFLRLYSKSALQIMENYLLGEHTKNQLSSCFPCSNFFIFVSTAWLSITIVSMITLHLFSVINIH